MNNENESLIIGAIIRSELAQIFVIYIRLLVTLKSLFQVTKIVFYGRNHVSTAITNLLYFTL